MKIELGPLPEPEMKRCNAWSERQMRSYAEQEVAKERGRWMRVVFDGFLVYQHLTEQAERRTSAENVSDTLDAVMRAIRSGGAK